MLAKELGLIILRSAYSEVCIAMDMPSSPRRGFANVGKIENGWLATVPWIRNSEAHTAPNRTIREVPIVRAQSCVCYSPLPERIKDGFVVFPVIRI